MNLDNPRTRAMIYRCLCIVIIAAGCKVGTDLTKPSQSTEAEYLQQMKTLSEGFAGLEKNGQLILESGRDPDSLLQGLTAIYNSKGGYVRGLSTLHPTERFKEFHTVFVEWRQKEHENEGQLLEGYRQFIKDRSKKTAEKVDALTKANDEIGKTYEAKILEIAKKQGFDSVEKFLAQPAK